MKVSIIGCGAVGSLFAGSLARLEDVEVRAYDVDREHVRAINEHGLRISGVEAFTAGLRATTDPEQLHTADVALVATKSIYTRDAMEDVAGVLGDTPVCSVQNGVGNEEIIAEHAVAVMRGTTFPAGRVIGPGEVAWDATGDTWIGPFEPRPASMEVIGRLAETLTRAGMRTRALEDARGAQWTKLIFNASSNPVGALTRLTHGRVCDLGPTRELISGLIAEGVAVTDALGIELDSDPEEMIDHGAEVAYDHEASMLQDVLAGRDTEVDFMNGGICRSGEEQGVPCPLNRAVWALVKGLEQSAGQEETR